MRPTLNAHKLMIEGPMHAALRRWRLATQIEHDLVADDGGMSEEAESARRLSWALAEASILTSAAAGWLTGCTIWRDDGDPRGPHLEATVQWTKIERGIVSLELSDGTSLPPAALVEAVANGELHIGPDMLRYGTETTLDQVRYLAGRPDQGPARVAWDAEHALLHRHIAAAEGCEVTELWPADPALADQRCA